MGISQPTSPVQITSVGKSWTQANKANYGINKLPWCQTAGPIEDYSGQVNYNVGDFSNFMRGLRETVPGMSRGTSRTIKGSPVVGTIKMFETGLRKRNSRRPMLNRYGDLRTNLVPGVLGEAWLGIEGLMAEFFQNPAVWGPAIAFTDGPIQSNDPLARPIEQINDVLMEFLAFRSLFNLTCVMDVTTATAFRQVDAYRDGQDSKNMLADEKFMNKFKSNHEVDEIVILNSAKNRAADGLAEDIVTTGRGLLWFGLTDKRKRLSMKPGSDDPEGIPDGAVTVLYSDEPYVDSWVQYDERQEYFRASTVLGFVNTRQQASANPLGRFFDPSSILITP